MNAKKIVALLLAVTLLLTGMTVLAEEDKFGKYDTPITISVLSKDEKTTATEYDASKPDRASAHQNVWIQAYKDFLNIDIVREVAEDDTALNARLNTGMASHDLPDVMIVPKDMFYVLAENGVLADLTDALANYEQKNLMQTAFGMWNGVLNTAMYEGELLGIPMIPNSFNSSEVLWIRQDWLNKVGKEAPTTLDELIDVAQAFLDAKLGGDNAYAIGMYQDPFTSLFAAYGSIFMSSSSNTVFTKQEDGNYIYTGVDVEKNSSALLKLQEMYKSGLLSKDFAVFDKKVVEEDIANSRLGIVYGQGWIGASVLKNSDLNDPEADWIAVPIPTLDGQRVKQWTNAVISNFIVVNANCKNPEAMLKMIELELNMYYNGTAEENLKYIADETGYALWDFRIFRNFGYPGLDFMRMEECLEGYANGATSVSALSDANYQRMLKGLSGDRSQKSFATVINQAYPIIDALNKAGDLVPYYAGPKTETMTLYLGNINEALFSSMYKVVMGEDISVYEKACEDWLKNGGETITNEVNEYYKANGL